MIKHGKAPYLECSSAGDKRFSAFHAMVNGKSIEERYQAAKIFEDGSTGLNWRAAKGRRPVNDKAVRRMYSKMWDTYIKQHPELLEVLKEASGLSDKFGKPNSACQATELWRIKQAHSPASNAPSTHSNRRSQMTTRNRKPTTTDTTANDQSRVAHFDAQTQKITVGGVEVPWILCKRCKGTGSFVMGSGLDAGVARCSKCQGKGKMYPADIIRNQNFVRGRQQEMNLAQKNTEAEFNELLKKSFEGNKPKDQTSTQ